MKQYLLAYLVTALAFFGMDFIWLSLATKIVYRPRIGQLLLDKPDLPVAGAFYLLYVVGILVFAVIPALEKGDYLRAVWSGALLGVVAYGTYDFTNLATLVGWSTFVSFVDLLWGTFATTSAAVIAYFVMRQIE